MPSPLNAAWAVLKEKGIEARIVQILRDEGGAAGLDALMKPLDISEADLKAKLKEMSNVKQHKNGDYILMDGLAKGDNLFDNIREKRKRGEKAAKPGHEDYPDKKTWAKVTKAKKKSKPFHGYNPKKHSKKGGLNAKGRAAAKRKTGANLKPPVTTKPSKLKPGSKKAKRRKSFCARMTGVKGPTSKKGKLTPKGASLKRWNC
jgi:hypothetical protein